MALRRAALIGLGEASAAAAAAAPARAQGGGLAQVATSLQTQQQRAYISVDVPNGNVDKAWRLLNRKMREEGLLDKASSREFYIKPSERRKEAAAASARRFRKQEFQQLLQWAMQRKNRGF